MKYVFVYKYRLFRVPVKEIWIQNLTSEEKNSC